MFLLSVNQWKKEDSSSKENYQHINVGREPKKNQCITRKNLGAANTNQNLMSSTFYLDEKP